MMSKRSPYASNVCEREDLLYRNACHRHRTLGRLLWIWKVSIDSTTDFDLYREYQGLGSGNCGDQRNGQGSKRSRASGVEIRVTQTETGGIRNSITNETGSYV